MKVVVQRWLESERGWGTRPDGVSIHLNDADRQEYINRYWGSMPDYTPDEYSRPHLDAFTRDVTDLELLAELEQSNKKGLRFWQYELKELPWLTS